VAGGSSPLARGLRGGAGAVRPAGGIIPARAGFTSPWPTSSSPRWDHPRSRGVYHSSGTMPRGPYGSSPLARGLPRPADRAFIWAGIIPARAGFTAGGRRRDDGRPDHPRSRGVYGRRRGCARPARGSSPLARGLPPGIRARPDRVGIIPARAGFTTPSTTRTRRPWDHPRSRGVYPVTARAHWPPQGSSPLARGLLPPPWRRRAGRRIIPARAGFTDSQRGPGESVQDHPRSRGVYASPWAAPNSPSGSSPLARGLHGAAGVGVEHDGIIPARAGFTTIATSPPPRRPDHPRSRGVYEADLPDSDRADGSSPLARGLLLLGPEGGLCRRIIPARAGFTQYSRPAARAARDHPRSRGVYR